MRNADDAADAAQVMQEVLAESRHLVALLARMESLMTDGATPSGRLKGFANRVVVKKDERTTLVKIADVQWVESKGNYVVLHTSCAEHVLRETLGIASASRPPVVRPHPSLHDRGDRRDQGSAALVLG